MSENNIPFEIQVEIIKRLPVRSLIQSRTVSKTWKSLIDSSEFVAHYGTQLQPLLLLRCHDDDCEEKYVSIVDDNDSFPLQRVSVTFAPFVKELEYPKIIGCSHGLFCLRSSYSEDPFSGRGKVVIWNPSIRKAVAVDLPNVANGKVYGTVLGFGVCRETTDPKILKITHVIKIWSDVESIPDNIPWQVEVFTISTGDWRCSNNLPRKSIRFGSSQVVVDGCLYWLAIDWSSMDGKFDYYNLIISFDMTSEEFKEINLPHSLAHDAYQEDLHVYKLRKSLVVLERNDGEMVFVVWMMEGGVLKTFTKLFTINTPDETVLIVHEFRMSGEPVIEYDSELVGCDSSLAVYDPYSKQFSNLESYGGGPYEVYAYMETLLLLDQPDFTIYNNGKRYILMGGEKNRWLLKHTGKV